MTDCYGCDDAAAGRPIVRPHTCPGSGGALAVAIHEAENIETPEAIPLYDVSIGLVVQAFTEDDVKEKLTALVTALLDDEDVSGAHFTVTQR